MGELLGAKLRALAAKHPSIGDVRGLGLFWAVDLVKDRATKEPFNTPQDKVDAQAAGRRRGRGRDEPSAASPCSPG